MCQTGANVSQRERPFLAQESMSHRPDIDGLRAAAILSVVVFHYGFWLESSGFAGVDLFFAISGFLITRLVTDELAAGTFSLTGFYGRRIRRILPALLVMIALVLGAGYFLLGPSDLEALAGTALAATFGFANFSFYSSTGYFDTAAFTKPLLHTWSLGVEEQFYLVWAPLLMLLAFFLGKKSRFLTFGLIVVPVLASFATAFYLATEDPDLGFYMPHARAWELGLGALAALAPRPSVRTRWTETLAVCALATLIGGFVWMEIKGGFDLWGVLAVVGGGALVLWANETGTIVNRLLSLPPFPAIGLVSYSLYLWHWPVLIFVYIWNNEQAPTTLQASLALTVAVVISIASYLLVERPARRRRMPLLSVYGVGSAGLAIVGLMSFAIVSLQGLPDRFDAKAQAALTAGSREAAKFSRRPCSVTTSSASWTADCVTGPAPVGAIAVIGDSFAGAVQQAISESFPDTALFRAACTQSPPLYINTEPRSGCERMWTWFYTELVPAKRFETVVIVARWHARSYPSVAETVTYLKDQGVRVIVIGQQPEFDISPKTLVEADHLPRADYPTPGLLRLAEEKSRENARMAAEVLRAGGEFFDPIAALCTADICRVTTPEGVAMAYDYGHLTGAGANYLVGLFAAQGLKLP
jgi:peptidoglycan/LPS O-acetylase OafA/YrhL